MQRELDEVFCVPDAVRKELPLRKTAGSYLIGRTLFEGAFGELSLALHRQSGQQVAVKVISKKLVKQDAYCTCPNTSGARVPHGCNKHCANLLCEATMHR